MKTIISTLFLFFFSVCSMAQSTFDTYFSSKTVESSNNGIAIIATSDSAMVVIDASICQDYCTNLLKIDLNGNLIWKRHFDFQSSQGSIIETLDKNYLILGSTTHNGQSLIILFKISANGDSLWYKEYGYDQHVWGASFCNVRPLNDSLYAINYGSSIPNQYSHNILAIVDFNGNLISEILYDDYQYHGTTEFDTLTSGFILGRDIYNPEDPNNRYAYLARTDSSGTILWQNFINYTDPYASTIHVKTLPNGNIALGYSDSDTIFMVENQLVRRNPMYVAVYDTNGVRLWKYLFPASSYYRQLHRIRIAPNGDILGCGEALVPTDEGSDMGAGWMFRLSAQGELLWEHFYLNYNPDWPSLAGLAYPLLDITETADGGVAATGFIWFYNQNGQGDNGVWVIKVDENGCLDTLACNTTIYLGIYQPSIINGVVVYAPATSIIKVFPNPASNQATVYLPQSAATLYVRDLMGNVIKTIPLTTPSFGGGKGEASFVSLNTADLANGLYFISTNSTQQPTKLIVNH